MATDGVKIIDSDLARDTYEKIMDLYDSGAEIEEIRREIPFVEADYGEDSDFYHEIFITAYGLAFWEIGGLTPDVLDEVKRVVGLEAGVRVWSEEVDANEGKKRKKALSVLLQKISQPNLKIRKRKKYRSIQNLHFQPDDVLTFRMSDQYYAMVCAKVTQQRGQCTYDLVATTFERPTKPSIDDVMACSILGREIGSGFDRNQTLADQPNVDKIWRFSKRENFFFGLPYHLVTHKDFISFKAHFEVIGKLRIRGSFKRDGSYGYISKYEDLDRIFGDLGRHIATWELGQYPVTLLLSE